MSADYHVQQITEGLTIVNTQAGELQNVSLLPDSNQLGAKTNYQVYFTTRNEIPVNSYVDVHFPKDYFDNLDQVSCSSVKTAENVAFCELVPGESNVIRIKKAFNVAPVKANTEVAFLLWNVQNPVSSIAKDLISNQFAINTISPDGYPIDSATSIEFAIGCTFPCATCAEEQNKCLTCLTLDDGTPLNYFAEEQTCLPECPVGYRRSNANVCEKCDSRCATCSRATDICDSCQPDSVIPYLDAATGYCQSKCPPGTYVNEASMTCDPCVNNCGTCNGPDFCIDCKPGFFFLND